MSSLTLLTNNASLYWQMGFEKAPNCLKCLSVCENAWVCCVFVCVFLYRGRGGNMYSMLHRHALASEVMIPPCLMSEYPRSLCDSRFASFFIDFIRDIYQNIKIWFTLILSYFIIHGTSQTSMNEICELR